jgi:hypothetical protein
MTTTVTKLYIQDSLVDWTKRWVREDVKANSMVLDSITNGETSIVSVSYNFFGAEFKAMGRSDLGSGDTYGRCTGFAIARTRAQRLIAREVQGAILGNSATAALVWALALGHMVPGEFPNSKGILDVLLEAVPEAALGQESEPADREE